AGEGVPRLPSEKCHTGSFIALLKKNKGGGDIPPPWGLLCVFCVVFCHLVVHFLSMFENFRNFVRNLYTSIHGDKSAISVDSNRNRGVIFHAVSLNENFNHTLRCIHLFRHLLSSLICSVLVRGGRGLNSNHSVLIQNNGGLGCLPANS